MSAQVLAAVIAASVSVIVAIFTPYVKWVWDERQKARNESSYSAMILAEVSDFARHCAANLKRSTEALASPSLTAYEIQLLVKKFKFVNEYVESGKSSTFVVSSPEILGLLPTHLVRAVMRIHLLSRNVEWHVDHVLRALLIDIENGQNEFDPNSGATNSYLRDLKDYFHRAGESCIQVLQNLDEFKNSKKHVLTGTVLVVEANSPVKPMPKVDHNSIVSGNLLDSAGAQLKRKSPYDDRPLEVDDLIHTSSE